MTRDDARLAEMRHIGARTQTILKARKARNRIVALERGLAADNERLAAIKLALAEAQDAAEIGGWDDSHVPSLADWLGAAAIVTCIFGLGVVGHALIVGWL